MVNDTETDGVLADEARRSARLRGYRSILSMPMIRDGRVIGVLSVTRGHAGAFSDDETKLLRTFADQAVIAIENVRLFTELQTRNRDLTQALDQQTATSEVLRVIAGSPTDVQPVFATIMGCIQQGEDTSSENPSQVTFWTLERCRAPV